MRYYIMFINSMWHLFFFSIHLKALLDSLMGVLHLESNLIITLSNNLVL